MKKITCLLPHCCIVLALYFGACSVLDWYNPLMNFTGNAVSSKLLVVFCLCSVCSGIRQIWDEKLLLAKARLPVYAAAPHKPVTIRRSA